MASTLKLFSIGLVASENRSWQLCCTLLSLRGPLKTRVSHERRGKSLKTASKTIHILSPCFPKDYGEMLSMMFSTMLTISTSPASLRFRAANLSFRFAALSSKCPTCHFEIRITPFHFRTSEIESARWVVLWMMTQIKLASKCSDQSEAKLASKCSINFQST